MKKIFTIYLAMIGLSFNSMAVTHTVQVGNFQFTPSDLSMNLGDTIQWMWHDGNHTSTSTQIPIGAAAWDADMNSNSPMFTYVPAVAGSYNFVCSPHASMGMGGHFNVVNTSGISEVAAQTILSNIAYTGGSLHVNYEIPVATQLSIELYDIIGNHVVTMLSEARQPAGSYQENYDVNGLRSGIYMFCLRTSETTLSRRILIP